MVVLSAMFIGTMRLSYEVLYLQVSDLALEVACLLEGEAEGGHVVV